MEERQASPASAFTAAPKEELLELPIPNAEGEPLFVRVRRGPVSRLVEQLQGIPELAKRFVPEENGAEADGAIASRCKLLARWGVVEPLFAFDEPEDGKPLWDDLHELNQIAIGLGALRIAGLGGPGQSLANFLGGLSGGRVVGERADEVLPAGEAAEQHADGTGGYVAG